MCVHPVVTSAKPVKPARSVDDVVDEILSELVMDVASDAVNALNRAAGVTEEDHAAYASRTAGWTREMRIAALNDFASRNDLGPVSSDVPERALGMLESLMIGYPEA